MHTVSTPASASPHPTLPPPTELEPLHQLVHAYRECAERTMAELNTHVEHRDRLAMEATKAREAWERAEDRLEVAMREVQTCAEKRGETLCGLVGVETRYEKAQHCFHELVDLMNDGQS